MATVKILSLNVRGIREKVKRRALFNYGRRRADIICLQETHSDASIEKEWELEWGGQILFAHGETNARGVCILFNRNLNFEIISKYMDPQGRILSCKIKIMEYDICIVNVYAPNKDTPQFFTGLFNRTVEKSERFVIIGDLNVAIDNKLDRKGSVINNDKSAKVIEDMINDLIITDVWRDRNPGVKRWSYIRTRPKFAASRIDNALVSQSMVREVTSVFYVPGILTDHAAIFISISFNNKCERGRGYWKFNNLLLTDPDFVQEMNQLLKRKKIELQHLKSKEQWELIKIEATVFSQEWSRNKASQRRLIISQLHEKISDMEERISEADIPGTKDLELLEKSKEDLDCLEMDEAKAIIFRTKSKWHVEAERNTAYFYGLEKMKYLAKTCTTLIDDDGKKITDPTSILREQKKYYQRLYTKDPKIEFKATNCTEKVLSSTQRQELDKDITISEMTTALKQMANGKCPGLDGLSVDFYKMFFTIIGDVLFDAALESFKDKQLFQSALAGVINLIPKPKKDPRKLLHLRPISLLNVDLKIIEKILANRIRAVIDDIIDTDQKGFLSNRRISVNIRKILDIMKNADDEKLEAVILSVDFQKCFDMIEHQAVYGSLKFFGFGEKYIDMVRTIYCGAHATVQNNGTFSERFPIQRGVRQGSPNSSFLFLLCAEILAIMIREEESIQGIPIKEFTYLLGQYADDMDTTMIANEQSISSFFMVMEKFSRMSGFRINYDKTTVLRIGSMRKSNALYYSEKPLHWTSGPVNILGVTIQHGDILKVNYEQLIDKAKVILSKWKRRNLSLIGKIQIVNTLISSLFVYKMMVLPKISKDSVTKLNHTILDFLWNGRKAKIALKVLQMDKSCGGLGLVNFEWKDKSLKLTWLKILEDDPKMANLFYYQIHQSIKSFLWELNLKESDIDEVFPELDIFWKDILRAWANLHYNEKTSCDQIVWLNSNIRIDRRPFLWNRGLQAGLKYIKDLYNGDCFKSYEQLTEEYGLNIMQSNSIKSAIKSGLEKNVEKEIDVQQVTREKLVGSKNISRMVYKILSHDEGQLEPKRIKWEQELNLAITQEDFIRSITQINRTTNITKLRSFQYRLINRALVTNVQLFKWKIKESPMCRECNNEIETVSHMLVKCSKLSNFWIEVEEIMGKYSKETINFQVDTVLWNRIIKEPTGNVKNMICLAAKQYIYRKKCASEQINSKEFERQMYNYQAHEKYYAIKNRKLDKHLKKWYGTIGHKNNEIQEFVQQYLQSI